MTGGFFHGETGQVSANHVKGMVCREILDAVAAAFAKVQRTAERAGRGCKADVYDADRSTPLIGVRPGRAGDGDGNFGTGTQTAVKKFQSDNGLDADGIAGKNTQNSLYGTDY